MSNLRLRTFVLFLILLIVTTLATAGIARTPIQRQQGDDLPMIDKNLFPIAEVDEYEYANQHSSVDYGTPPGLTPDNSPHLSATIDEIKSRIGTLFVPSTLPNGFALQESSVGPGELSTITYVNPTTNLRITVDQHSIPAKSRIKRGHVQAITVNRKPGYLVREMWVETIHDGRSAPAIWDSDIALSVMYQEETDRWINIRAVSNPEKRGVTEQNLLDISESCEAY